MRPLRPQTRALIERLERPRTLRERVFGRDDRIALLDAIGASREPGAIVHLISFLMAEQPVANAASSAIARIIRDQPLRIHIELEHLRHFGGEWSHPAWWSLTPGGTRRLAQLADGWAALGMASLHANGFVREAAVLALGALDGSEKRELPFLVLRLNDWVAQVRRAALDAMENRLSIRYADALVRTLPLIHALGKRQRADHRVFIEAVLELLRSPEARPAILRSVAAREPSVRRESFKLALESAPVDAALLERALADRDVIIRVEATRRLTSVSEGALRRALLERALDDSAALVRRTASSLLPMEPESWRQRVYEALLYDSQPALRELARRALTALLPGFDAAALYRKSLTSANKLARLRGAIFGLGDCGAEEDVLLLPQLSSDPRVKIRAAVLHATAALDRDSVSPFAEALLDSSKRVSRAAARVLEKRARTGLANLLLAVAEREPAPPHTLAHVFEVLRLLNPWTRLLALIRATSSPRRALAELAHAHIDARTGVAPSSEQLTAVEGVLPGSPLSPEQIASIEAELRFWRQRKS